jgi:MFS family permease
MWVYALGAPFAGIIADRVRRKNLILGGCLFWSGITCLTGFCGRMWQFVTIRALEGLGETFYFPASMSLISDYHSSKSRSRALSIHQASVYVGTILGSWAGAAIAERFGWRYGFYLFGALGIVLALVLWRSLIEPVRGGFVQRDSDYPVYAAAASPPQSTSKRFAFLLDYRVLLLMGAFVCANSVATVFLSWTPTYLVDKFHYRMTGAGLTGQVYIQVASALTVGFAGAVADRLTRRMAGGRILVQAVGLLAGASFVFMVGATTTVGVLLFSMTAFGLFKGLYDSGIFASLFDFVDPAERGVAAGLMNTVGWGGGAIGPMAVGWISDHGRHASKVLNMSEAISFGSIVYLAGAVLLIVAAVKASGQEPGSGGQAARLRESN